MTATDAMPGSSARYRLNEPAVITDVIDGEPVIMNLARGSYYSLNPTGSQVWQRILEGMSVDEIAGALANVSGIGRHEVRGDLERLVAQLLDEELIVAVQAGAPRVPGERGAPTAEPRYEAPVLTVYADMKDLLALDPPLPG